jgi:hypothetical protein
MTTENRKGKMAAARAKHEFTDEEIDSLVEERLNARKTELIEEAAAALGKKQRREKIQKAGGALDDAVGLYVWEAQPSVLREFPDMEYCLTPSPPVGGGMTGIPLLTGDVVEVHEGDRILTSPWRKLTPEEAALSVSLQAAFLLRERLIALGAVHGAGANVKAEKRRNLELIEELKRRDGELEEEAGKADARVEEAKKSADAICADRPVEWQRAAILLADRVEERWRGSGRGPRQLGSYAIPDEERALALADLRSKAPAPEPPQPARAMFAPRGKNEGRRLHWNSTTNQMEEM